MQCPFYLEDIRQRPQEGVPEFPKSPLADRDYQKAAVKEALKQGRGVLNMPPRSGKTQCGMAIQSKLGLKCIWTAPTDAIVRQTMDAFQSFFGDHYVIHQQGTKNLEKAINSMVIVCTAATAARLPPEVYRSREMIMVDEWHHSAAKTYRKQIFPQCEHIYFRYGMTGTHFRSGFDEMAMHSILSNEIYRVTSHELLSMGYLVPTRAVYIPVDAPKLRCGQGSFITHHGKHGIHEHEYRNQLVAYTAAYLANSGRRVLVLVGTKVQGRKLQSKISYQIPDSDNGGRYKACEFISTDRARGEQQRILKAFNEDGGVKVLVGTSLVGEGVDLPPADALVYARGEKAEVSFTQNVYRVCTASETKRDALIVDFADRHHRKLMAHSKLRLQYLHADPVFGVEILPSVKNFGEWLRRVHSELATALQSDKDRASVESPGDT